MKTKLTYSGLLAGLAVLAGVYQNRGSDEVSGHAFAHLIAAGGLGLLMWMIQRPSSTVYRWIWRGGWGLSIAQFLEALGAFGYDDRASTAIPGLRFVHNVVAPLSLLGSFLVVVFGGVILIATKLPKKVGIPTAAIAATGVVMMLKTMIGV